MYVCAIDLETTGLDIQNDHIIEVGAVVWEIEKKRPCLFYDALTKAPAPLPKIITELTGLTDEYLDKFCISKENAIKNLNILMSHCSYIIAHNGTNFDKPFYEKECKELGLEPTIKPWIDTSVDIPYPPEIQTRKLKHLAAEHGFVNPFPHRAITDVLTMLTIMSKYDFNEIIKNQQTPNVKIVAKVDFANKEKASSRGYRWDQEKKQWTKTIKQNLLDAEIKNSPFEVKIL